MKYIAWDKNLKKGYTLMEVIVTMSIFMVLASITFAQNPQGFDKIRFNTYVHELIINMKQLQIFGAAAGDVYSNRVSGAGVRFTKSNTFFAVKPATPFYDKVISGAEESLQKSDLTMEVGEEIKNIYLAYENKVKVDFICSEAQYNASIAGNTFIDNCTSAMADALIIRPNTKFNIFMDNMTNRTIENPVAGNTLYVQLSYAGINSKKCISIKDNIMSIISNQDHDDYGCRVN